MRTNHAQIRDSQKPADDGERLLSELQVLLERQIELASQGDVGSLAALAGRADALVTELARAGATETPPFEQRRQTIQRLYERLSLMVTTAHNSVGEEVKRIRMGRKVLGTYGRSLRRL